jgi:sarcosine oxidase, subunit beta
VTQSYDAIIIGGGIMGCSTALELARRGMRVALLEKEQIGAGATGRSSAIIRQHYSNELTARMALHSLRVFQNFDEAVGGVCGFKATGFVALVRAQDQPGLEANIAMQRSVGIQTQLISSADLQALMPGLALDDVQAAAYEPESGHADPHLTVSAYAAAARRQGVEIHLHCPATGIRFEGDRVVGVETPGGFLSSPVVVNCAGPWGAQVARWAGYDLPINACRIQVAFFRRPPGYEREHPVVVDFVHASYLRSETGNLTLAGLVDPAEANAIVDPDHYAESHSFDFTLDVGERMVKRWPAMEQAASAKGYAGLYAVTPDWHPIMDELPAGSGFYVCTGFSGHGFKLAPAVGLMMAERITGAEKPTFDSHRFRFSRYAEEDEVRGRYEYSIAG